MPPRRSHRKSRNGCQACKQRRVKCDEAGSPCGNCKARRTECWYTNSAHNTQHVVKVKPMSLVRDIAPDSEEIVFPANRQLLQAQLMHRWSTITYRSVSSPTAKDYNLWQSTVPEMALRSDFLLHGMFAVSAFDMANSYKSMGSHYTKVALEHQDIAIRSFHNQLHTTTPESCEACLYFSVMLVILSLASARFASIEGVTTSMIHNTIIHFELIRGIGTIMQKHDIDMAQHPLFRYLKPITKLRKAPLDSTLDTLLRRLSDLNERRIPVMPMTAKGEAMLSNARSCRAALSWLRECFVICIQYRYRDYCLIWPSLAGKDYMSAVRDKDKIALLILMYWGVQVHWLQCEYWWAMGFGKSLVDEVLCILSTESDMKSHELISWAKEQVSIFSHSK